MDNIKPDLSRLTINRTQPPQRTAPKRRIVLVGLGLVVLVALALGLNVTRVHAPSTNPISLPSAQENHVAFPALAGATPATNSSTSANILNATGYVVAQRKAAVSSKATGRLKELNAVEGDTVKSGQILGTLENDDLKAALAAARAALDVSRANIRSAEAELADAEIDFSRLSDLLQQGVISRSEYDRADARLKRARAETASMRANLALGEAQLNRAEVDFEFTIIRAPFDGTVLTKNADVGEIVAPFGSATNARAAVVTIADMTSLQVEADVSESNISRIFLGQAARITLDSYPEKIYRGRVEKIVPTVDRAKATVMTKIKFEALDARVLPEMSAKVAFELDSGAK